MSTLVSGLAGTRPELAVQFFYELRDQGVVPNLIAFNSIIHALSRRGRADEAKQIVQDMQAAGMTPSVRTYSPLIVALGKAGLTEEAGQARFACCYVLTWQGPLAAHTSTACRP